MAKTAHHKLDIYGTELHAAYDRRGWSALRRLNSQLDEPDGWGQTTDSRDRDADTQHIWLWIDADRHTDPTEFIDTLAHEATHATQFILGHRGISIEEGNGEAFAYLVGWLTAWLLRNAPD